MTIRLGAPSAVFLAAVLGAIAPMSARADIPDSLGLGPEAQALGGAVTAVPVGPSSVHHAPALLAVGGDRPGFGELEVAFLAQFPATWITRLDGTPLQPSAPARETLALGLGARFDVGHLFGAAGRLVLGLSIVTPVQYVFRWNTRPDDWLQWYELTDANARLSAYLGLGARILDWLSMGASLRVTFDSELYTTAAVTAVSTMPDPRTGESRIDVSVRLGEDGAVRARLAPIVGFAVHPTDWMRVGFNWRASTFVDDWGWSRIQGVPGLGDLGYVHRFAHYFRPHELSVGAAVRPIHELELSADLTWMLWSEGLTGNHQRPVGRFADTWVPAVGARWSATAWLDLLAGWSYVRAPYDNFGGPTNLLVSDRHVGSIGAAADLGVLTRDRSLPLVVRGSFRLGVYEERTEIKDFRRFPSDAYLARNPGAPGYRFGAFLPSFQISVEARW